MKAVFGIVLAVGVMSASVQAGAPAGATETSAKPCCSPVVTKAEFNSVRKGMTVQKVIDRFDNHGRFLYRGGGYMAREWTRTWRDDVVVQVSFQWNAKRDAWLLTYKWAGKPYGD